MMSSHTWMVIAFLVFYFCSSFVLSETKLQFISIPVAKQKVSESSNLTINCSTNDANASTAVYYRRRGGQNAWKLLKPGVDQIVQVGHQVYILTNAARKDKGQYQCRSWKGKNGTVISWPLHVGKVKITKDKGKIKKVDKISGSKKPVIVKGKLKRLSKKDGRKKRPQKKTGNKRDKKRRPGFKRNGKKRKKSKKGNKKRQKGGKKSGKKTPSKNKKDKGNHKKKNKKPSIQLKTSKTHINAIVGRNLYINCVARYYPANPKPIFRITWYKDGKLIGQPFPSHLTITSKTKPQKRKDTSLLKLKTFQAADKGTYVCRAMLWNGRGFEVANSLTVQVNTKS